MAIAPSCVWLPADLFDASAPQRCRSDQGTLDGVVEHTCFCGIDSQVCARPILGTIQKTAQARRLLLGPCCLQSRERRPPFGQ